MAWKVWNANSPGRALLPGTVRICPSGAISIAPDVAKTLHARYLQVLTDGRKIALRPTEEAAGGYKIQLHRGGGAVRIACNACLKRRGLRPAVPRELRPTRAEGMLILDLDALSGARTGTCAECGLIVAAKNARGRFVPVPHAAPDGAPCQGANP